MRRLLVPLAVVFFCSVSAQNAIAQADLGMKSLGVKAGFVSPEDMDATLGLEVFADHGTLTPNIRLASHLGFWSKSEDIGDGEASVRDVTLGMRGTYMFPVASSKIQPYAGAGLGIHFLHAEVDVPFPGGGSLTAEDSSTKLGLDIGGGFMAPMSPQTDLITEAWYGIVDNASTLSLKIGLGFKLSR